ncbi:CG10038, partial [Drosophila busckii]
GELRRIDAYTGRPGDKPFIFEISKSQAENQAHYEKLADQIPEIVYELLERNGLSRTYIPLGMPPDRSTFIFTSALKGCKKLLVLIHGSGYVRAGQWARSLVINNSLDHGTQLPYIQRAQKLGYDIVVTNTNDNDRTIDGQSMPIKGVENAHKHAAYVWKHIVMPAKPESVAIVAHSFGGLVVRDLAEEYSDFFREKVFAIALTDPTISTAPACCKKYFLDVTCNWVSSNKPLDAEVARAHASEYIKCVSAGHPKHEWSSYSAMESVIKFIEDKYEQRVHAK